MSSFITVEAFSTLCKQYGDNLLVNEYLNTMKEQASRPDEPTKKWSICLSFSITAGSALLSPVKHDLVSRACQIVARALTEDDAVGSDIIASTIYTIAEASALLLVSFPPPTKG